MRRLLALALVVAVILCARLVAAAGPPGRPSAALALGFTVIAAMLTGELLRRFRLPRITGYLLFGVLVGPYAGNLITEAMAQQLRPINGIATTLIAFIAGLTLNFERLERRVEGIRTFITWLLVVAIFVLFAVAWAAWPLLPFAPGATGLARLTMSALFAVVVISFSPTMTAAVISETNARGRVSDVVLATVVVADLVALVLFAVLMQGGRLVLHEGAGEVSALVRLAWEIGGAIAFGGLVGASFALYLKYMGREVTLVLLGVCALLSQVGSAQRLEPLLAAMTAGLVIQNVAVPQGDALKTALRRGALPVLIVFFVSTGVSLQLDAFRSMGLIALALALVRLAVIRAGVGLGLRAAAMSPETANPIWAGLISQAGITLGLASVLASEFPEWAGGVQTLVIALIAADELIGPTLFRMSLVRTGEIDATSRRPLIVVSNREPYAHRFDSDGRVRVTASPGGVAVALDALMRERKGVWIASGDGDAEHAGAGADSLVHVPPDRPSYLVRRLWFDRHEYAAYYGGFANEGLWPLCHAVDVRPKFRSRDWAAYQAVNDRFAQAINEELPTADSPVFIQDYHLALVAERLRERCAIARTALFWHIPWPYPDRLRICPWRRELMTGLLANDLLAFQLERDRRNFVAAAVEELGAEIETEDQLRFGDRVTNVVAVPIGVDYDRIQSVGGDPDARPEIQDIQRHLRAPIIGLGVDRLDYTKGIPERLEALDRLFAQRPELRGQLTFVQIAVPSRSELGSYSAITREIDRRVEDINRKYGSRSAPAPVFYYKGTLGLPSLVALYRLANFCLVSSLHDGMNLVAKEFVAAREDEDGVLVLSALAGAAQELRDALIINPYDIEEFADVLATAVDMRREERQRRMREMRRVVAGRNVFSWASDILEGLESLWTRPLQHAVRAPEDAPV